MKTETFEYSSNADKFRGYLVYDETRPGKLPGILVVHEAWGLGDHAKERAERLAKLGYVALAVDMVGDGKTFTTNEEAMGWVGSMRANVPDLRRKIRAAYDALAGHSAVDASKMGGIGYCIGGTTVLELARSGAPVKAVVSFHGGLTTTTPAEPNQVKAKLLVCTGSEDHLIPAADINNFIEEMRRAGADYQVVVYGGAKHSFTNPNAAARGLDVLAYQKSADERSWNAMHAHFDEAFA